MREWLYGIIFLIGFATGMIFGGIALIGQGVWEHGHWMGLRDRIPVTLEMDLKLCASVLREEPNLHPSQQEACATILERLFPGDSQ